MQDGVENVAIAGSRHGQSAQEADIGQDETQKPDQTCVCTYEFQEWKAVTEKMINNIGTTEQLVKCEETWKDVEKEPCDPWRKK